MKSSRCRDCRDEVIWWALLVNVAQTAYKGCLGVMSGSAALVADSLHSGADVVASAVTMTSVKLSGRPANEDYPFGYGNIQFISSAIVGLILILGALYLMYGAIIKIIAGDVQAPSAFALLGAVVSVVTNELMYRYQSCVGIENNSPAIIANAWDNRSDAMSSVGVLIGIGAAVMGFPIADVLAAMVVAVLVARIGVELNIDAIDGLMDSSVEMDILMTVYDLVKETPLVHEVRHLRGRNVGEEIHLDIGICVDGNMNIYESDFVCEAVRKKILAAVDHVTDVHISVLPRSENAKIKRRTRGPVGVAAVP